MKRTMAVVTASLAAALAAGVAAQATGTVTDAETGQSFPATEDFGGAAHSLIGVGAFEAYGAFNVYGAGFYLETESSQRSWQRFLANQGASFVTDGQVNWDALKNSSTLYQWIYSGSFPKAIWIKVVRDVTRQEVLDMHTDLMRRLVDDYDTASTQPPLKNYIDAVCNDGVVGDELRIWTKGTTIYVKGSRGPLVTIEDAGSIIRVVWQLWFGGSPISVPLRRGLVNNLENLGGPAESP
ncbi:MAG: hypothetical protein HY907_10100 [Deltaproteobacteria bacterium]|nr:hypothetical protein [Deltaproteobacteria bacterium]